MSEHAARDDGPVLVVGGAGYIGHVLVRRLLAAGREVRVLDALIYDHGSPLAGLLEEERLSFLHGDLNDPAMLGEALEGASDVVLLAALVGDPICSAYPEHARIVNQEGAKAVFDAAASAGAQRFVFTSTCSNYGLRETEEPATEEDDVHPLSLYAETKVAFERYVLERVGDVDLTPVLLRISTAYGLSPRMRFDLTISEFARTLAAGDELIVYDADTWRPYCHVADISDAIITTLGAPADLVRGEVFNVGHDEENYTKRMVVDAVLERLGGEGRVSYVEGGKDPRNYRVSFDKIHERLGFEPRRRMAQSVDAVVTAVQAGVFDDVGERPGFYGNREVSGIHVAAEAGD